MHMQQIEIVIHNYIYHITCKCYFVWRIIKQRICRHTHFVIKNIGIKHIEPHRLLVSNKVNVMTFIGKCFTKLGSQYAAAAKSRIANNSYSHDDVFRIAKKQRFAYVNGDKGFIIFTVFLKIKPGIAVTFTTARIWLNKKTRFCMG